MSILTNELLWFIMLVVNFAAILLFFRLFGKIGLYVWIPISTIIANIQVTKLVMIFGISATLGNIVYASSFLVTDILSELYGEKDAKKAVALGFASLIVSVILMQLAILFVPTADDFANESIKTIFGLMPRIMLGSLCAFGLSQLHDVWAYQFWRKKFPSRKFIWIRNNASTMVSQLIDSIVFTAIAFAGVFEFKILLEIFLSTYIFKFIVSVADTPCIYLAVKMSSKIKDA